MKQFLQVGNRFRLGCGPRCPVITLGGRLKSAISDAELSALDPGSSVASDAFRHADGSCTQDLKFLLLRALSAPVRIAIVVLLCESPRCVHELVGDLGLPQPLVSQRAKVLKAAGVVAGDRVGREVRYRLVDTHVGDIAVAASHPRCRGPVMGAGADCSPPSIPGTRATRQGAAVWDLLENLRSSARLRNFTTNCAVEAKASD